MKNFFFSCALKFPGCEGQVLHAEEAFKAEMVRERWLPISLGQAGILCSFYEIEMIRLLGFEGDVLLFYSFSLFCDFFSVEKIFSSDFARVLGRDTF